MSSKARSCCGEYLVTPRCQRDAMATYIRSIDGTRDPSRRFLALNGGMGRMLADVDTTSYLALLLLAA